MGLSLATARHFSCKLGFPSTFPCTLLRMLYTGKDMDCVKGKVGTNATRQCILSSRVQDNPTAGARLNSESFCWSENRETVSGVPRSSQPLTGCRSPWTTNANINASVSRHDCNLRRSHSRLDLITPNTLDMLASDLEA